MARRDTASPFIGQRESSSLLQIPMGHTASPVIGLYEAADRRPHTCYRYLQGRSVLPSEIAVVHLTFYSPNIAAGAIPSAIHRARAILREGSARPEM